MASFFTYRVFFASFFHLFFCLPILAQELPQESTRESARLPSTTASVDTRAKPSVENPRARALREETIEIATRVRSLELLTASLDKHVTRLQKQESKERERLFEQYDRLSLVLQSLLFLERSPEWGLFLHPNDALAANRGQSAMAWLASYSSRVAQFLESDLRRISALQREIDRKQEELSARLEDVASYRRRIARLSARKQRLMRLTPKEQAVLKARAQSLLQDADSLRALLRRLDQDSLSFPMNAPRRLRDFPPQGHVLNQHQGEVIAPINGVWLQRFGSSDGFGQTLRGILIAADASAQVLAPFDGRIVFADFFLDQGKLLIIEHKGGYHTVVARVSEFFVSLGQWVLAGEPVGRMGKKKGALYFEIRHKGKTQNPQQWIKETPRSRAFLFR